MSIEAMKNAMRLEAERVLATKAVTRLGTITSYDPANAAVKVMLQPEPEEGPTETGFIPLASQWIGNGWGMFAGPSAGDQVVVEFQEATHEAGIATQRLFDNQNRPLPVPSGEFWLVHQSGAFIKLTNDGKITLNTAVEIDAGNLGGTLHTLLTDAFLSIFNNHVHTNGDGGADTGVPVTPLTTAAFTTVLKAN